VEESHQDLQQHFVPSNDKQHINEVLILFSYQHEFHAGNYADILKHITLALICDSLCKKEKPFTLIDSHAGAGRYHLDDERSLKTGEAESGIKKLFALCKNNATDTSIPQSVKRFLELEEPYLMQNMYAGSPEIERLLMRENDKLFLVEKHPAEIESLLVNMKLPLFTLSKNENSNDSADSFKEKFSTASLKILEDDSYKELSALTPPLIKRGLVLTDPSYEEESDYKNVTDALKLVHKKWNTAVIALWYPLLTKKKNLLAQMLTSLEDDAKLGVNPTTCFRAELAVKNPDELYYENNCDDTKCHMYGSGMLIINPPYQLKENLEETVKLLEKVFSEYSK